MRTNRDQLHKRCNWLLQAMLGDPELVKKWWHSPNKHWNLQPPKDQAIEEVYEYLMGHASW